MSTDPRLEAYLAKLERVLAPFPAGDRAEIIMEIKSHVEAALERDPEVQLDSVLAALGEPETVANRYLMERGFKTAKPPISPIVKWLVIGFLGTVAMCLIFAAFVLAQFSPVFKIDGDKGNLSLLGGAIQISGEEGTIRIGDSVIRGDGPTVDFEGSWESTEGQNKFEFKFNNAKMDLENASDQKLIWKCRGRGQEPESKPTAGENGPSLDLRSADLVKCEVSVPEKIKLRVEGMNGKITVTEPHYHLDASLNNGKVRLDPDEDAAYRYSLSVMNGKVAPFKSSVDPKAYEIKVSVKNGKISRSN